MNKDNVIFFSKKAQREALMCCLSELNLFSILKEKTAFNFWVGSTEDNDAKLIHWNYCIYKNHNINLIFIYLFFM